MALTVAIAGYGLAGSVFHAPLVAATDGLELAAVVTRDPERREQLAREHPGVRAADRLEDVVQDVDLVVVATPNRWHAPLARTALDAGRHVVVDKPLAVTAADARDLVERAGRAQRLLLPFHNRRWDDDFLTLRALVDEGRLGRVLRLESRFDRWRPEVSGAWREGGDPAAGGGLLLDLGTHICDQAVQLLGPPVAVYAELDRRRPGAEVEDDVFIALEHEGGARSHLWASVVAAHIAPRFRVLGDRAAFVVGGVDPQEAQLRAGLRPGDEGFGRRDDAERAASLHTGEDAERVEMRQGDWPAFYRGVEAAIREGAPPPVRAQDGAAVLELLEAARHSAQTRSVVVL